MRSCTLLLSIIALTLLVAGVALYLAGPAVAEHVFRRWAETSGYDRAEIEGLRLSLPDGLLRADSLRLFRDNENVLAVDGAELDVAVLDLLQGRARLELDYRKFRNSSAIIS